MVVLVVEHHRRRWCNGRGWGGVQCKVILLCFINKCWLQYFYSSAGECPEMMKSIFTRASMPSSVFRPALPFPNRPRNYAKTTLAPSCSSKLQMPLFLQPAIHKVPISDLKKWHIWAKNLASSVGSTFVHLDNGPDSTLLHRELNWLIEDVLDKPTSLEVDFNHDDGTVSLRTCLDDLYSLWKQRIEERRPFQYIVGCEHWRDLVLCVQEGVLIPRPETEQIVDMVNDVIQENKVLRDGLWADLGTGSGALAIAIGKILGSSGRVFATDISPVAVDIATYNVQRYNLQEKVQVKKGSWFEPLKDIEGKLAGLVSNPPYIPTKNISGLQAEVGRHEPKLALDGGVNGLNDLLHLCCGASSMLSPGGFFAFETNDGRQTEFLLNYMEAELKGCFSDVKISSDIVGINRFISGYRA